jgi:hypothetical protein
VLTHVRELVEQNAEKMVRLLGSDMVGVYSAGLKSRDTEHPVIAAGIQSVYRRACELGPFDLCVVDEAHLLPPDGEPSIRESPERVMEAAKWWQGFQPGKASGNLSAWHPVPVVGAWREETAIGNTVGSYAKIFVSANSAEHYPLSQRSRNHGHADRGTPHRNAHAL